MRLGRALAGAACVATTAGCAASAPAVSSGVTSKGPAQRSSAAASMLRSTWQSYATQFIHDGHVVDPSNGNTTSEGQSYAMLRAAWMDDRTAFDSVWSWTRANLWQQASQRFGWIWAGGRLLSPDSATDADQDIALALVFAAHLWHDGSYMQQVQPVLQGIWQNDVAQVGGTPFVVAGNWAAHGDPAGAVLDPSYFAPYAYRVFARVDGSHPWMSLVGSSYAALNACSRAALDTGSSVGLPPNWCVLDRSTGQMRSFSSKPDGDDYGYDAFRVMWRIALDEQWSGSPAARAYLATQAFLRARWHADAALAPVYGHDGLVRASGDDLTVYGGDIGAFLGTDTAGVAAILQRLTGGFHQEAGRSYWGDPANYYEQNWVWFGVALGTGSLANLAA